MDFYLSIPLAIRWIDGKLEYSPLIFEREESEIINYFIDQYRPDKIITIDCEESRDPILKALSLVPSIRDGAKGVVLVSRCLERSEGLWSERINAIFGSYIASLNNYALLWTDRKVDEPIIKAIEELGAEEVVLVGDVKVREKFPVRVKRLNPPDIFNPESYADFYERVGRNIDFSTLIFAFFTPLEGYTVLAPLLASINRAPFVLYGHHSDPSLLQKADFDLLDTLMRKWKPEYLLAVVTPYAITPEWIRNLYRLCTLSTNSSIKVSAGIITGLTVEDASLLVARRYALSVNLKEAIVYDSSSLLKDMLSIHGVHVHEAKVSNFKEGISDAHRLFELLKSTEAGIICINSHSNNDRMKFHDFSYMSPNPQAILDKKIDRPLPKRIPPSIVLHGGCHSARISGGIGAPRHSLALNFIRAGAISYIGTIMHNYPIPEARSRLYMMLYKFIVRKKSLGKILTEELNYELSHPSHERGETELPMFILIGDPKISPENISP